MIFQVDEWKLNDKYFHVQKTIRTRPPIVLETRICEKKGAVLVRKEIDFDRKLFLIAFNLQSYA